MNKLVIVGNGFDLAHGLKTGYSDFINWRILKSIKLLEPLIIDIKSKNGFCSNIIEDGYIKITINSKDNMFYNGNIIVLDYIQELISSRSLEDINNIKSNYKKYNRYCSIEVKYDSFLFSNIVLDYQNKTWVDIESQYYKCLINISKGIIQKDINSLNKELIDIKKNLEEYIETQSNNINIEIYQKIFLSIDSNHDNYFLEEDMQSFRYQNMILNFNYTNTPIKYIKGKGCQINNIHGQINDKNNTIIFGYGDELDEDYQKIERLSDNRYLENFKSKEYLQTRNYTTLLNYLEQNIFYVYVLGHSLGLSDRTLLNTIFEHKNCKFIKIFYHQYQDSAGNLNDNFNELILNITRMFNDKKLMRSRVINKEDSEPMPQNKEKSL